MIFTTKEQSERLLDSGLDIFTADAFIESIYKPKYDCNGEWCGHKNEPFAENYVMNQNVNDTCDLYEYTPCWSFGALWQLCPNEIEFCGYKYHLRIDKYSSEEVLVHYYSDTSPLKGTFIGFNTLIDKCSAIECMVKMVEWLIKNNHLDKKNLK